MDEDLELFLEEWGHPSAYVPAREETLQQLAALVPSALIGFWRRLGFSAFRDGLMALCEPQLWKPVADEWIEGTELSSLDDYVPVMRGAFGEMQLLGVKHGLRAKLYPTLATILGSRSRPQYALDIAARGLFATSRQRDFDTSHTSLDFAKARRELGPLQPNEIYGFVPVLPMGGTRDLAHLRKVDAFAHLSILRQATGELRGIMEAGDLYR